MLTSFSQTCLSEILPFLLPVISWAPKKLEAHIREDVAVVAGSSTQSWCSSFEGNLRFSPLNQTMVAFRVISLLGGFVFGGDAGWGTSGWGGCGVAFWPATGNVAARRRGPATGNTAARWRGPATGNIAARPDSDGGRRPAMLRRGRGGRRRRSAWSRVVNARAAAPDGGCAPRRRPRMALRRRLQGVLPWPSKARVVCWCYLGSESVGLVDATGRSVWLARRGGGPGASWHDV